MKPWGGPRGVVVAGPPPKKPRRRVRLSGEEVARRKRAEEIDRGWSWWNRLKRKHNAPAAHA